MLDFDEALDTEATDDELLLTDAGTELELVDDKLDTDELELLDIDDKLEFDATELELLDSDGSLDTEATEDELLLTDAGMELELVEDSLEIDDSDDELESIGMIIISSLDELDDEASIDAEESLFAAEEAGATDDELIALTFELLLSATTELEDFPTEAADAELGIGVPPVGALDDPPPLSPPPPPPQAVKRTLIDNAHRVRNA